MLMDLLLKPFEWTVNRICQADECFFPRLQPYRNKVMRLRSRDGLCQCDCVIQADQLDFYADYGAEPDVTLILTPMFIKNWLADPKNPLVFFDSAYEIQGDMQLAENLKAVFTTLEIDVEGHLAQVIGDPLAVNLCYAAEQAVDWGQAARAQFKENMRDYLQDETEYLVPPVLVDEFIQDTRELRDDVDRLEARIHRLSNNLEAACGD